MKIFFISVMYLLISSCYVYSPSFQYESSSVGVYSDGRLNVISSSEAKSGESPALKNKCGEIKIPNIGPIPSRPSPEAINAAQNQHDVDILLTDYIKELKAYIKKQQTALETIMTIHKKDC